MVAVYSENFSITRQTKGGIPTLPFVEVKNEIMGEDYELSLFFPNIKYATELHMKWKKKPGPANILSFPLDDAEGEIFLSLSQARKEAPKYGRSYKQHLLFLFIHGCLHLKGMTHGAKMEQQERFWYDKFEQKLNS
jgi:probable rRNA maturation factor